MPGRRAGLFSGPALHLELRCQDKHVRPASAVATASAEVASSFRSRPSDYGEPIRISDIDQRPYKALSASAASGAVNGRRSMSSVTLTLR